MTDLKFYKLTLGILFRIAVMLKLFFKELKLTVFIVMLSRPRSAEVHPSQ
jgi:hypothetical protein